MVNYIVLVNKRGDVIVIDSENKGDENSSVEIGYETDCSDWNTDNEKYMVNDGTEMYFDMKKAFKGTGIYKVEGYSKSDNTPDGWFESYVVANVTKISDILY